MSLLDSLLLDAHAFHVWIAYRTDGIRGTGTLNDPYNGSTQASFDAVMAGLPNDTPLHVHLGPTSPEKPFRTRGFYLNADGTPSAGAWQPKANMAITGSGIDVTHLQLVQDIWDTGRHYFAIGAPTTASVDFFAVSNFTIDCNLPANPSAVACGAIRVMGHHVRVRDIKVVNWGSRTSAQPGLVIALIIADPDDGSAWPAVDNVGIENCIAVQPSEHITTDAIVNVFHVGGRKILPANESEEEVASQVSQFGRAPFIRNCFIDGSFENGPDFGKDIRALSMDGCYAGVVEGNQVRHVRVGGPHHKKTNAYEMIVRNNVYHNVVQGPSLGGVLIGPEALEGSATLMFPGFAGGTIGEIDGAIAGLKEGDIVKLETEDDDYDGMYFVLYSDSVLLVIGIEMPVAVTDPTSVAVNSIKKVTGLGRLLIEGNTFELAGDVEGFDIIGIQLDDGEAKTPHRHAIIRGNRFRYADGLSGPHAGYAMDLKGVQALIVSDNIIETIPEEGAAVAIANCRKVTSLDNRLPEGSLLDLEAESFQPNFAVPAEDALLSASFDK